MIHIVGTNLDYILKHKCYSFIWQNLSLRCIIYLQKLDSLCFHKYATENEIVCTCKYMYVGLL